MSTRALVISPAVPVELGGRTRGLKLDLNAIALIDEQLGVNLLNDPTELQNPSAAKLRVFVWAGLVGAGEETLSDPETGIKEVGSWIDFGNYADMLVAITKAFTLSIPEPGSVTTNGTETPKNPRRG